MIRAFKCAIIVLYKPLNLIIISNSYKDKHGKMDCGCPLSNKENQLKNVQQAVKGFITQILATTLTLSECDLSKRHDLFDQIIHFILYVETKGTVKIFSEVMTGAHIPFDYLYPFLQYYSAFCEKQGGKLFKKKESSEEISFIDERKKIIKYKNSLKITNYFEKVCGFEKSSIKPIQISFQSCD